MHWRDLLARLKPAPDPLPELVRASADRSGQIDRRAFLSLAGATVAALSLDPEALIWTPGEKAIIVPGAVEVAGDAIQLYAAGDLKKGDAVEWGLESLARHVGAGRYYPGRFYDRARYLGFVMADAVDGKVFVQTTKDNCPRYKR